jgi:phosphoserine phosphatase RsbU/P
MITTPPTDASRLKRLRALTEVSRALTYTTSIGEVLDLTVERAAELVGGDKALIMLADADGLLTVRAARGVDSARMSEFHEPLSESLIRRLQGLLEYQVDEEFLSVPLVAQGQVTGLLATVRATGEQSTADDEWLLSALADQAAVALENTRLAESILEERSERTRVVEAQGRAHATLGHELRSPLSAIHSYSSLLLENVLGPLTDRQREAISRIRMSGQHLLAIIEDVLDVARLNAGAITLATASVRVRSVLDEAVHIVQPLAVEKDQTLTAGGDGDMDVDADPNRLRQALVNLLGNAVKYTPAGGAIGVNMSTVQRRGRAFAAIAVTDNGRGIEEDVIGTLFEPYSRGSSKGYETGLGLGLFISRELVRRMGGEIEVISEPGIGSTFTTFLPVNDEPT